MSKVTTQPGSLYLVEPKESPVKRTRRRADRDPLPKMGAEIASMAKRTRSLRQTAGNMICKEIDVVMQLALACSDRLTALERAVHNVDGFGLPVRKGPDREIAIAGLRAVGKVA